MCGQVALRPELLPDFEFPLSNVYEDIDTNAIEIAESIQYMSTPAPDAARLLSAFQEQNAESRMRRSDVASELISKSNESISEVAQTETPIAEEGQELHGYLSKMENFENEHTEDRYLSDSEFPTLVSTFKRMDRVQKLVGHGNFNVLGFDEMLRFANFYERVGSFQSDEIEFLEKIFSANATEYGFFGEKVIDRLTLAVPEKERVKVFGTGHFLFRGDPEKLYQKVKQDVGPNVVLTSGIRSVVKQTHLFLAKTIQSQGNLSRASRSLAPPGHSYHGVGDFDVGKVGFGRRNFTADFARTPEFRRLVDLGYIDMRYPLHNLLGVRYEPWHIKVA